MIKKQPASNQTCRREVMYGIESSTQERLDWIKLRKGHEKKERIARKKRIHARLKVEERKDKVGAFKR